MQDNDDLLNMIKRDLSKENIQKNDNQISLYDLYNLVNSKYKDLRNITENNKIFCNKEFFSIKQYNQVIFIRGLNKSEIYVYPTKSIDEAFIITKTIDNEQIYVNKFRNSSNKFISKFIKNYYNEIMYIFSILEKYGNMMDLEEKIKNLEFKCCNYSIGIWINLYGVVNLEFKQNEELDSIINSYKNDFLINVLEENKFELAKKIMINVDELDYQIRDIVFENSKNSNKKLVK